MKLHLGSGRKYWPGWHNVDLHAEKVDEQIDIRDVDYPRASVSQAAAIHVLEHLTRDECLDLCRRCLRWLRPGGTLQVEMPDREKCLKLLRFGKVNDPPAWDDPGLQGLGGLMGDRPARHAEWVRWLSDHRKTITRYATLQRVGDVSTPDQFEIPGERHRYVWAEPEFADALRGIGYREVRVEKPRHHGKRDWRDMRVVGVKG